MLTEITSQIVKPSIADLAYIAGFFDGEGCISVNASYTIDYLREYPRVTIANTEISVLEYIQSLFGGMIRLKKKQKKEHDQGYQLSYSKTEDIERILTPLIPYLRLKKEQALIVLQFGRTIKPNAKVDEKTQLIRAMLMSRLRDLNKKGENDANGYNITYQRTGTV